MSISDVFAPSKLPRLTEEQKTLAFQSIRHRTEQSESLPDLHRVMRRTEAKIKKAKSMAAKLRLIDHAVKGLQLVRHKAMAKYRSLESMGAIDEPDAFWDYLWALELIIGTLSHRAEALSLEEGASEASDRKLSSCQGDSPSHTSATSDIMDVEEVSAYLKVSKSTIYHLSASGDIPVSRIGTRLIFRKVDIDTWMASA